VPRTASANSPWSRPARRATTTTTISVPPTTAPRSARTKPWRREPAKDSCEPLMSGAGPSRGAVRMGSFISFHSVPENDSNGRTRLVASVTDHTGGYRNRGDLLGWWSLRPTAALTRCPAGSWRGHLVTPARSVHVPGGQWPHARNQSGRRALAPDFTQSSWG